MLPLWHFFIVQIRFPGEYWLWSNLTACYRIALCREQWTCRCRHSDWWFVKCDKECIRWHWIRFRISGHRVTDRFWGTNAALWLLSEPEGKLSALFVTGILRSWFTSSVLFSHLQQNFLVLMHKWHHTMSSKSIKRIQKTGPIQMELCHVVSIAVSSDMIQ